MIGYTDAREWGVSKVFNFGVVATAGVVFVVVACGRGPTPPPRRGEPEASPVVRDAGAVPRVGDAAVKATTAADGSAEDATLATGLRGQVTVVEGEPGGRILLVLPGQHEISKSAVIGADGRFEIAGIAPATYRLILPADGVHSTADLYVKVAPDAGLSEVTVPRSRGCPVKIALRAADGHLLSGAMIELTLPDLPPVDEPHVARVTTNDNGRVTIVGSCVRGFFEGRVIVPDRGTFDVRHGYVGTGRDQFDIVLPEGPDAGVTYANDD